MTYAQWIETIQPTLTPNGASLEFRLDIYPDGHGAIVVKMDGEPAQPVGDAEQAARALRDLWQKAARAQGISTADPESELKALLDQIPDDYQPEEIDWGPPRGREVW